MTFAAAWGSGEFVDMPGGDVFWTGPQFIASQPFVFGRVIVGAESAATMFASDMVLWPPPPPAPGRRGPVGPDRRRRLRLNLEGLRRRARRLAEKRRKQSLEELEALEREAAAAAEELEEAIGLFDQPGLIGPPAEPPSETDELRADLVSGLKAFREQEEDQKLRAEMVELMKLFRETQERLRRLRVAILSAIWYYYL